MDKLIAFLTYWLVVAILIIELFLLYLMVHRPHDVDDIVFPVTLIAVTLWMGTVGLFLFVRPFKNDKLKY